MTDRWQFSTEGLKANFCPDCGSLLELPPAIGNVRCTLCPYTCNPEELETKVVVSRMSMRAHNDRKRKGVAKTEEKRATIELECEKCGHPEMLFHTQQLRSADEGQTIFYECVKCGHKYAVNT